MKKLVMELLDDCKYVLIFPLLICFGGGCSHHEPIEDHDHIYPEACGIVEGEFCLHVSELSDLALVEANAWYEVVLDSGLTRDLYARATEEMQEGQDLEDTESGRMLADYLDEQMAEPKARAVLELQDLGVEVVDEYGSIPVIHIKFHAYKLWDLAKTLHLTRIYGIDFQGTPTVTGADSNMDLVGTRP